MLKTQLYEKLEYYQQQKDQVEKDLEKILKILENTKEQRNKLLSQRSDLYWKIEEIKDVLEKGGIIKDGSKIY